MEQVGKVVMTRSPGRGVYIGRGVIVTVVSVNGQQVRLAIEAPKDHAITRDDHGVDAHLTSQRQRERKAMPRDIPHD
jgi:carbon storage regulator CsrA